MSDAGGVGYDLDFAVNKKGDGCVVLGIKGITKGREGLVIRISGSKDGRPVVGIADDAFKHCDAVKKVVIPCSVETIGRGSFWGCENLEKVVFEEDSSLKSIGRFAFYGCEKLKSIEFPESVTDIGESAFESCGSLSNLRWGKHASIKSIGEFAFWGCSCLKNATVPKSGNSLKICEGAFAGCGIESVTFAEGEKQIVIGKSAFRGCAGVTEITFPRNVVCIGECAFRDCVSLENVSWAEGQSVLETIGVYAFSGCRKLRRIIVPKSEKKIKIGRAAFEGCFRLIEVVNLSGLRIRPGSATHGGIASNALKVCEDGDAHGKFGMSDDESWLCFFNEPNYGKNGCVLTSYRGCEASLKLPRRVECNGKVYDCFMVGGCAFCDCGSLESVTVPETFKEVGDYAFYKSKITRVTLPEGITKIGNHAFAESALESVNIPGTVTEIGASAFEKCKSLKRVIARDLPSWLGIEFGNEHSNPLFCRKARLYWSDNDAVEVTDIVIGDETRERQRILPYAFAGATLRSVKVCCGIAEICDYAFYGSEVVFVSFSGNLESIGDFAFYGCQNLGSRDGFRFRVSDAVAYERSDTHRNGGRDADSSKGVWDRVDIRAEVGKFMAVYAKDPCSRYHTYDYVHGVFLEHMREGMHGISELSQALFIFLASWGMFRGSSFLLYKSPGFLSGICEIVCDEKYRWLTDVDPFSGNLEFDDGLYVSAVCELKERITGYFVGNGYYKGGDAFEEPIDSVTDKQVSKILLVTLGCVPAYDTFVTEALRDLGIGQTINEVGLKRLLAFTRHHEDAIKKAIAEYGGAVGTTYSVMKYVDMALWGYGYPLARKNGKTDDDDAG